MKEESRSAIDKPQREEHTESQESEQGQQPELERYRQRYLQWVKDRTRASLILLKYNNVLLVQEMTTLLTRLITSVQVVDETRSIWTVRAAHVRQQNLQSGYRNTRCDTYRC
jgi:hypothetical protein